MGRLSISISDEMHRALKTAAARQGRSIGSIIEEGLHLRGIKPIGSRVIGQDNASNTYSGPKFRRTDALIFGT